MHTVDNRGLACPEPVIRTKRALDGLEQGSILSIVDNAVARDNVLRLARNLNCTAEVKEVGSEFHIEITKGAASPVTGALDAELFQCSVRHSVLLVKSNLLGEGDPVLGEALMKSFWAALAEAAELPATIYFLNSGVRLTVKGSPVLERLRALQERGVQIQSCGTCLDFYGLTADLAIGEITNMYSIIEGMLGADRAITL
jgi:selenium metabolism protein YedF